ncbi:hypothetical protein NHF45_02945 [Maricaulaceae bacterium NA33B04]|nr:hypothetical protein [Maricaulaceae bacterium NA33B04]
MSGDTVNFEGDCGQCDNGYFGAKSSTLMEVEQSATINGDSPSKCMLANDGGKVFNIDLKANAGVYDYQIQVEAQGPVGAFSGYMHLAFQDDTDDVYYLKIVSSKKLWHTVSYDSSRPGIKAIYWSDKDFTVNTAKEAESDFQVTSPDPNKA